MCLLLPCSCPCRLILPRIIWPRGLSCLFPTFASQHQQTTAFHSHLPLLSPRIPTLRSNTDGTCVIFISLRRSKDRCISHIIRVHWEMKLPARLGRVTFRQSLSNCMFSDHIRENWTLAELCLETEICSATESSSSSFSPIATLGTSIKQCSIACKIAVLVADIIIYENLLARSSSS
jgi:hypothetical protein